MQTVLPAAVARATHSLIGEVLCENFPAKWQFNEKLHSGSGDIPQFLWDRSDHVCDMADPDVPHESFAVIHIFYVTYSYVQHSAFMHSTFTGTAVGSTVCPRILRATVLIS